MSDFARPEYDPSQDKGNFPLEHWAYCPVNGTLTYDGAHDRFLLVDGNNQPTGPEVQAVCLMEIVGIGKFRRARRFEQPTEHAALRYFQHEQWLRTLQPADPTPHTEDD